MIGIPSDLYSRLVNALSKLEVFDSDQQIQSRFVDDRISIWHDALPQTSSRTERIAAIAKYLFDKYNTKYQENALVLFLCVLIDQLHSSDSRYQELTQLLNELQLTTTSQVDSQNTLTKKVSMPRISADSLKQETNVHGDVEKLITVGTLQGNIVIVDKEDIAEKPDSEENGRLIRPFYGHSARVNTVNISDDDKLIVSGGSDKKAYVWDIRSGKFIATLRHERWVASVALAGNLMISSDAGGNVYIWDYLKQQCLTRQTVHNGLCRTLSLSSDRSWFATGGNDGDIHLWELPSLAPITTLRGHLNEIRRLAVNPKARQIISGDANGHVYLWDLDSLSYRCIYDDDLETVRSVAYSRNGELAAITFSSGAILIWDIKNDLTKWHIESGHLGHAVGVSFHPVKPLLASGGADGFIRLWNWQKRDWVGKFHAHENQVNGVVFSSDGRWLVSGSRDRKVCLWDMEYF